MMRNIQFRGLSNTKKWVYGSLIYFGEQPMIEFVKKRHHDDNRVVATDWVYVVPDSVGQSTEMQDRKGQDIYENDIVQTYHLTQGFPTQIGVIKYLHGAFCVVYGETPIQIPLIGLRTTLLEVIGNTTENKELLKDIKNEPHN